MQSIQFLFSDLSKLLTLLHLALEIGLFSWIICVLTVLIIFIFFPAILLNKFLVCFSIVYFTFAFFDFYFLLRDWKSHTHTLFQKGSLLFTLFYTLFISLNSVAWRLFHISLYRAASFFFMLVQHSIKFVSHNLSIQCLICKHLGSFQNFAVVTSNAMDILLQISFYTFGYLHDKISRSRMANSKA